MTKLTATQAQMIRPARLLAAELANDTRVIWHSERDWELIDETDECIFRGTPEKVMHELRLYISMQDARI